MSEPFEQEPGDEYYEDEPPTILLGGVEALADAGWHLRQIRRLRERRDESGAVYQREMNRLHAWVEGEDSKWSARIAWHEAPLRQLSERFYRDDPKRKTIDLPDGALKLRVPSKPQVFVDDAEGLLAWVTEHAPHLIPAPTAIRVMDLRRDTTTTDGKVILAATGEIVPHVHAELPGPTWCCDTDVENPL